MRRRFGGIYPVLYAFWDQAGGLDLGAMAAEVENCLADGAHGITVLGLVTEVHKMTTAERLHLVRAVGRMIGGRVPYAVTIAEETAAAQIAFAAEAADAGADFVILQPPRTGGREAAMALFGEVADAVSLPVALQNNPVNLPVSLEPADLVTLCERHEAIRLLKAEGYSVDIAATLAGTAGHVDAFGGHGGIEFPALMRAGGAGLIPAPDFLPVQVRMFALMTEGSEAAFAEAERLHEKILPAIVFMSRTVPGMLCYGKRLYAKRIGAEVFDRAPALEPTAFGLAETARFGDAIDAAIAEALRESADSPAG